MRKVVNLFLIMFFLIILNACKGYDGNGDQNTAETTQTTKTNAIPTGTLSNIIIGQEDIKFDTNITDIDSVINMTTLKVNLYKNGTFIKILTLTELNTTGLTFDGLLSNNSYTIKAECQYVLNDGNGVQSIVLAETTQTTKTNAIPTGSLSNIVIGQEDIKFDINITDIDSVINMTTLKVNLYKNRTYIKTLTLTELNTTGLTFDGLLSNNSYTIKAECQYDLNDGNGVQSIVLAEKINTTNAKGFPFVDQTKYVHGTDYMIVDINIRDINSVINMNTLKVNFYKDETVISTITLTELNITGLSFEGLLPDIIYRIKVECQYDLNDGNGVQSKVIYSSGYSYHYLN